MNWIWWHRLFWLDWFTSFLRESWTAYFHSSASWEWIDSQAIHEDSLSSILLIEWINATKWAIDSLAIWWSYVVTNVLDSISTSSNFIESVMTLSLVEFCITRSHDYFVIYLFIYLVIFSLHFFAFILFITFINWV